MSQGLNILMGQSFTHMVGTEEEANKVVDKYKETYTIKKSTIDKKTKKGVEYWVVKVEIAHLVEKDAFELYFDLG